MLSGLKKQLEFERLRSVALISLVYCVLFNSAVVLYKFDYLQATFLAAIIELVKQFFYSYVAAFIMFLGFNITPWMFVFASYVLFLTSAPLSFYLYAYKVVPNYDVIKSAFDTNAQEAWELMSFPVLLWVAVCAAICWHFVKKCTVKSPLLFTMKVITTICFIFTLYNFTSPVYKVLGDYFPTQYVNSSYRYMLENAGFQVSQRVDITQGHNFNSNADEDVIGVLVIGEAARSDHFSLGRYLRRTNPRLEQVDNLFFYQATSCSNVTYRSVTCMLSDTDSTNAEDALHRSTFLSPVSKLGFKTTWIGTQSLRKYFANTTSDNFYDDVNFAIIPGGSSLYRMNAHDEKMLPYFRDLVGHEGKQFFVLHSSGSHWAYDQRYPTQFKQFAPTCSEELDIKKDPWLCPDEKLNNSYDNSILYTDYFLSKVIEELKDKNSFVVYASDHGESLGENGRYVHGGDYVKEQYQIPLIFWMSDKFIETWKMDTEMLKENQQNKVYSHDNILHTILDCLKIESSMVDKKMSLCQQGK